MVKEKEIKLATGWLSPNGKFEEVSRWDQQSWAARHLIKFHKDLTHYGREVEDQLQEKYNYMKFEDGVLMSAIWRKPDMEFTEEQKDWINDNLEAIDPYTKDFLRELEGE